MKHEVFPPWSPIEVCETAESVMISIWGRQYQFNGSSFLSQVKSTECNLLASPITITAQVDGSPIDWNKSSIHTAKKTPQKVVLEQTRHSDSLGMSATISVEYDGLIRVDWQLAPIGEVQLDELTVDIPLKREQAPLFYYCPRRDNNNPGTGAGTGGVVPKDGFTTSFAPYIWFGNEERGLAWFCESAENWSNDGAEAAIEIVASKDVVILRLRLITESLSLAVDGNPQSTLAYTFGLQGTPVKAIEKSAWDTRIYHVNQELPEFREVRLKVSEEVLDSLSMSGVKTLCLHEHWTDIEGYFTTDYSDDLKLLIERCHDKGMQVLLYFGFLISDLAPEWPVLGAECVVHPDDKGCYVPFDYPPQPIQNAYTVCYNSRWQAVTVEGISKALSQYNADGIYLDGTTIPWGCRNQAHGCGYSRSDGTRGYTYPVFAVRKLMKSLYEAVLQHNPNGQVNVHSSYYLTVPTIAWSTGYTNGEQFAWDEVEQQTVANDAKEFRTAALPLDRFRCEFMGYPLGVPADFLADTRGPFSNFSEACSFSLLHDVPVRIWMRYEFELQKQLWMVRDDFSCSEAEWLPYWRNSNLVEVETEGAYCSLHRHQQRGILAIVSNLSPQSQLVISQFDLKNLGLSEDVVVHDQLDGNALVMERGLIKLELPPLGWKIIRIENR